MSDIATGEIVVVRDGEWLVARSGRRARTRRGSKSPASPEWVRVQNTIVYDSLDRIERVDPRSAQPVFDDTPAFRRCGLWLESDVWSADLQPARSAVSRQRVEEALHEPGRPDWRLRGVLDAWCALWLWPLDGGRPPTLGQWLDGLEAVLGLDIRKPGRGAAGDRLGVFADATVAAQPVRMADVGYTWSSGWNEKNAKEDGYIEWRTEFPDNEDERYFDNAGRKIAKDHHAQGVKQGEDDYWLLQAYLRAEDCGDLLDRSEPHPDGLQDPELGFVRPDREAEMRAAYAEFAWRLGL